MPPRQAPPSPAEALARVTQQVQAAVEAKDDPKLRAIQEDIDAKVAAQKETGQAGTTAYEGKPQPLK